MNKIAQATLLTVTISGVLLSGCGQSGEPRHGGHPANEADAVHHDHTRTASGDLQEKTASIDKLPAFLDSASQNIVISYQTAATIPDILAYIPCYCGCGDSAGHRSNLDCFIAEMDKDGSVVWDDHGTRCGVCMEIAVTAAAMNANGIEAERIRAFIDDTYKEGYVKPTLTELPPA